MESGRVWLIRGEMMRQADIDKERGINNLVILGQPFFHQTTLFFCE